MGSLLTRMVQWWYSGEVQQESVRILLLGLDGAGKTSILYKLQMDQVIDVEAILRAVHIETVSKVKGVHFTVWDIAGGRKLRPFGSHYFHLAQGIIFVVDSADRSRLEESREQLYLTLQAPELRSLPVMVLANKQDLPGAASVTEVAEVLQLEKLNTSRPWGIEATSVITGAGLISSLEQMNPLIRKSQKQMKQNFEKLLATKSSETIQNGDQEVNEIQYSVELKDEDTL